MYTIYHTAPLQIRSVSRLPLSARIFAKLAVQLLTVTLLPHVFDIQLLLPLTEVIELLDAAAGSSRLAF